MKKMSIAAIFFSIFLSTSLFAYDVNKDLTNYGPVADDIAVILSGSEIITAHYDGYLYGSKQGRFYSFSHGPEGSNTKLHWQEFIDRDNNRIDNGQTIHVGWSTADHNCQILDMYWTDPEGKRIAGSIVYNITSGWTYETSSNFVKLSWDNIYEEEVFIYDVQYAIVQDSIPLELLNYENDELSEMFQPLDGGEEIVLAPGEQVSLPLESSEITSESYIVLRYDVFSETGSAYSTDFIQFQPNEQSSEIRFTSADDWAIGIEEGTIQPLSTRLWKQYMEQWYSDDITIINDPYPETTFIPAKLYAWDGSATTWPLEPGMVMSWGDENQLVEGDPYASAWTYNDQERMDLTDAVISIIVFPPEGIDIISFGLQDINGNIRAWYWNVGETLPSIEESRIIIKPSVINSDYISSADPKASAYMTTNDFDITQVVKIMFDENGIWVADTQVPPPGMEIQKIWNYWRDLIITY